MGSAKLFREQQKLKGRALFTDARCLCERRRMLLQNLRGRDPNLRFSKAKGAEIFAGN